MRIPHAVPSVVLLVACGGCASSGESGVSAGVTATPDGSSPPTNRQRPAAAQPGSSAHVLAPRANRLVELALASGRAHDVLADLCRTAPHRLAGSPGAARAVAWGRDQMQKLGLQNIRLEKCKVPRWVRGEVERLRTADGENFAITALGSSVATPQGGLSAEVVMVRTFKELERLGDAVRGKIVFFNRPMNPRLLNTFSAYGGAVNQRSDGPIEAARAGGVAALVRSMTTLVNDYPHTGNTRYEEGVTPVPAAAISTKGADRLAELLARGPVRLQLELSCRTEPDVESANVVGDLPGSSRADEIVVIGGHLDAWDLGHGAHDDGAGIAHCLAAIDLLQRAAIRPQRTIRVVLYMNEENGTRGALAYVQTHAAELHKHVAAIESDRGGLMPRGFTTTARGARLERLKAIMEPLRPHGMGIVLPGGGGVDIGYLAPTGTELFGLLPSSQRYFDYHHSDLDRIEAVNARELNLGAAALAFLVSVLADAS